MQHYSINISKPLEMLAAKEGKCQDETASLILKASIECPQCVYLVKPNGFKSRL